ncbi:hypothetical protein ABTY59_32070 [Streptomyces sp. NPDC096079]|uniref:hypothetical protein n=1 Tax=Streptomyces sp. NPDC096079 TaxID=3155820 RepID=UPI003321E220
MTQRHNHSPADITPGTITLCATKEVAGGLQWAHLPVDRGLWAEEELREGFRTRVRRAVGSSSAPVEEIEIVPVKPGE